MIKLTDNNKGQYPAESFSRDTIASLFPLSDKPISQLCKENENLLLFPYCLDESNDEIEDSCIFSIKNTDTPNLVTIETSNLMGFIGVGDLRIKIGSRFDNGEEDYFLHYMLQQVIHINLFDLKHNKDNEDALDFSVFMFPLFLKRAMRQGFYREYKRNEHNDKIGRAHV